jgi:hypothetical protein
MYSVHRYLGIIRASGADHVDWAYQDNARWSLRVIVE